MELLKITSGFHCQEFALGDPSVEDDCPIRFPPIQFPRKCTKVAALVAHPPHARTLFERVMNGQFVVTVTKENDTTTCLSYRDDATSSNSEEELGKAVLVSLPLIRTKFFGAYPPNSPFSELPDRAEVALRCRVAHWVLRHPCASELPVELVVQLFDQLIHLYCDERRWKDYYDLLVARAHWGLRQLEMGNNPSRFDTPLDCKYDLVVKPGEALEAMKRYGEAGDCYLEACKAFADDEQDSENSNMQSKLTSNAGLAKKRNGEHKAAESLYVQAWNIELRGISGPKEWDLLGSKNGLSCFHNMIKNYQAWATQECFRRGGTTQSRPSQLMEAEYLIFPFVCLLYLSGVTFEGDDNWEDWVRDSVRITGSTYARKMLRKEVYKGCAKKTLFEALSGGGVDHYRRVILGSKRPDAPRAVLKLTTSMEGLRESTRIRVRDQTRAFLPGRIFEECSNCEESSESENLLLCPCKGAKYCCKACQREDWKRHKQTCSTLK